MNRNEHIIREIRLRANASDAANPFQLRSRMQALCSKLLPERLDKIFASFDSDELIELPSIHLNLQVQQWDEVESAILDRCSKEVEKQLLAWNKKSVTQSSPEETTIKHHSVSDVFYYFLAHGVLPWWADYSSIPALEEDLVHWLQAIPPGQLRKHLQTSFQKIPQRRTALLRLANQFSEKLQKQLIELTGENSLQLLQAFEQIMSDVSEEATSSIALSQIHSLLRMELMESILENGSSAIFSQQLFERTVELKLFITQLLTPFTATNFSASELSHHLQSFFNEKDVEKSPEKLYPQKRSTDNKEPHAIKSNENAFFVSNAGLVLLHPFLEKFFDHLQLLDESAGFRESGIHRAVHLLQHLYTDETDPPEFKMILNKILCGMPVEFPLEKVELTNDEKSACNELLEAVIKHWTALKNTSPEALQAAFLKREGKLEFKNETWWLKVEQKTEDILLDRLPWSISRIKTRWMKNWLRVEWNS